MTTHTDDRAKLLELAGTNIQQAICEGGLSPAMERLIDSIECLIEFSKLRSLDSRTLLEVTKHSQHHIFDLASGKIVRSKCACGTEFSPGACCEEWRQHILSLAITK